MPAVVQEYNLTAAELALMLYQDYVRRWLLKMSGYECQQADGEFMLAFASPVNAVQFCLLVTPHPCARPPMLLSVAAQKSLSTEPQL